MFKELFTKMKKGVKKCDQTLEKGHAPVTAVSQNIELQIMDNASKFCNLFMLFYHFIHWQIYK